MIAEGSGRIKLDDEVHDLQQWDVLRIGPGVMRNLEAGSDGMTLIAFGAPIAEESDGEIVPVGGPASGSGEELRSSPEDRGTPGYAAAFAPRDSKRSNQESAKGRG